VSTGRNIIIMTNFLHAAQDTEIPAIIVCPSSWADYLDGPSFCWSLHHNNTKNKELQIVVLLILVIYMNCGMGLWCRDLLAEMGTSTARCASGFARKHSFSGVLHSFSSSALLGTLA
jgi:hypothetical protein